jgi:hypothetical protein
MPCLTQRTVVARATRRRTVPMRTTQPSRRNQAEPGRGQPATSRQAGQQPRPTRVWQAPVRQAPATGTSPTAAERASLRALGTPNRASARLRAAPPQAAPPQAAPPQAAPPRAARPRAARDGRTIRQRPALRRSTGIVLAAGGAILWLAVHVTVAFVAIQRAGLVLLVTGLVWLWLPVRGKRDRLRRRFDQVMTFLEWDPGAEQSAECSLEDLLQARSGSSPGGPRE